MDFISLLESKKDFIQEINKYDFNPKYCEQHNLVWNKLLRLSTRRNQKFFFSEFPQDIVILISNFSLGINTCEYIYYLNSLHSSLEHVSINARQGNRIGYNYGHKNIKGLLSSLKSKIGTDFEKIGLQEYIHFQLERIRINPTIEKKYIQNKIDLDIKKIYQYAQNGNQRMTKFYKRKTERFMIEFDPTQLFRLNNIEIDDQKTHFFEKEDFLNNIKLSEKYALEGNRQIFEYYKEKLSQKQEYRDENIIIEIKRIEKIITPELEIRFLSNRIFRYLDYAKKKAEVKDQAQMDRYLNQVDRNYQKLITFSLDNNPSEEINNKINNIHQIFNCPF